MFMSEADSQISTATQFVDEVDLPPAVGGMRAAKSLPEMIKPVNAEQSLVVGHGVLSFLPDLPSKHRETVASSFLLAQLAADKQAAADQDLDAWYRAFFEALKKLGWLVQEQGFKEFNKEGTGIETHKAILDVASVLLGSASAAFDIVKSTLESLNKLSRDEWIILFRREAEAAAGTLFQIAVAEQGQGGISISLMAFQFRARSVRSQVIFLKWNTTEANLRQASGKVFFSNTVAQGIGDRVANKVRAYIGDYITDVEI
jgi:hypothetical protein